MRRLGRRSGLFAVSSLAVLALTAVSASAAWAGIELKEGGHLLREGKFAHVALDFPSFGGCRHEETGNLVGGPNPAKKAVTLFGGEALLYECSDEFEGHRDTISGSVNELRLAKTGEAKFALRSPVAIEAFGPGGVCVYDFAKLMGRFPFSSTPHIFEASGSAVGKLDAGASSAGCAKTETTGFSATASGESAPVEVEKV